MNNNNKNLKVLIADNDKQNLYLLEVMLKNEKYEVIGCRDGDEALKLLKRNKIDLIISDILMPKLDGFELCRECKKDPSLKNIPFIFYTATYINDQDKDFALSLGADRFVIKPAEPDILIAIVRELVSQYLNNEIKKDEKKCIDDEKKFFEGYSKRLSGKLESKILKLDETNKALNESEKKYRIVVNSAIDAIAVIQDDKYKFVNPSMEKLTGYSAQDLYDLTVTELIHNANKKEVTDIFSDILNKKEIPRIHDYMIYGRDKELLWIESIENDVLWDNKPAIMSFIRDITDKKLADIEIRKLNAELEKKVEERTQELLAANKELETFSYSVSHDLKAPLRAIEGFSKNLIEKTYDQIDKESKKYLDTIINNTQEMSCLIDNLLSFSKIISHEMQFSQINMESLIKNIISEIRLNYPDRNIEFIIKPMPDAFGDISLIKIALTNLIANAVKFTCKKTKAVIELGGTALVKENKYFIKDNGAGFDMKYVDKIFGVFQRLHRHDEFEGTGIGLALTQRIINRHGGSIKAEGVINKGASFYFTLPVNGDKK